MVRMAVHGAGGRMGRSVIAVVKDDPDAVMAAAVDREGSAILGLDAGLLVGSEPLGVNVSSDVATALRGAEVVIDFSLPEPMTRLVAECERQKRPAVIGTTGLDGTAKAAIAKLATVAPVVVAPNFSQGVNVLFHLAARAAKLLGKGFDAEIVEMHHRLKVDAPSGTAVRLAEVVAEAKELDPEQSFVHGRSGQVGARRTEEMGVMTLRGGDVVGEHTLLLAGLGERIELTHRATDRAIFARGAVRAAHWVVHQPPGLYDMGDVLGIAE